MTIQLTSDLFPSQGDFSLIDNGLLNVTVELIERFDGSVLDLLNSHNPETDWLFIVFCYFSDQLSFLQEFQFTHNDPHLGNILYRQGKANRDMELSWTDIGPPSNAAGSFFFNTLAVIEQFREVIPDLAGVLQHLTNAHITRFGRFGRKHREDYLQTCKSAILKHIKSTGTVERISRKSCPGNVPLFDDIFEQLSIQGEEIKSQRVLNSEQSEEIKSQRVLNSEQGEEIKSQSEEIKSLRGDISKIVSILKQAIPAFAFEDAHKVVDTFAVIGEP
jgi:hypothetical protein